MLIALEMHAAVYGMRVVLLEVIARWYLFSGAGLKATLEWCGRNSNGVSDVGCGEGEGI